MTAGSTQSWESTLDSVVVYAQGAVCRRLTRGRVPSDGRVRVTGLPRTVDPGSLRARVLGASGLRVTEARVEAGAGPLGPDAPQGLRDEAERLKDACEAARGRRDRVVSRIEEVGALRPVPPPRKRDDPQHRRTPVDAWLELAGFVDERLTGLHHRLAELEEALLVTEHEAEVAADRLARASTDAPSAHVGATVSAVLTLDGTGEAELELEYGVPGAVWVPAYRLAYRQGDGGGRLVLRASVAQRTGEDWTGVRIALATADLRRRTDLPKLRSIRIGRSQPAPAPAGWREPPAGLAGLFSGYDAAGPRTASPVTARAASLMAGGAPAEFLSAPPPPPPPSAPMRSRAKHGGPPAPGGMSYGAAPAAAALGAPAPAAPGSPPPVTAPPPPPSPPAGPPRPSSAELDYQSLVLSGPDEQGGRRGRLFADAPYDPVVAEHRRRAEAVASLPLPGQAVRPRESAGSFDHRFDAAARADVPSDGTWHTVTVGEVPVGLRAEYLCVPSVEQTVYATLVLSNATDQALLAGPVEVTVDDEFLLTAALPTLAPGGVRRVGLGPAEGVRVTRRTNLHESASGLRGNTTVLNHGVRVELANGLARPVRVEVHERVPVTSDPDVRIEERAGWAAPVESVGPDRYAPGTRIWRLDLPAGATAALDGGYEIRIPTGKALVGGNRRS
ncbi:DUF4139 domain-containing protein [Streptomyces sp. NBC_01335]|uniref:DUF4139 domain-containing protein n=1 Tax=Streptomyces sp. NBC_01335 TaxID=2903828 RepID=UPI002E0F0C04|nr:DUF4139 domain-containing protein [Streptomyces sp. NBC_01335]